MNKFIQRIVNYILQRRRDRLAKTLDMLKPRTYTNSSTKTHINASETLTITSETNKILDTITSEVINIVKTCETDPKKLLDFVQNHGTPVYKIKNADKLLKRIKEEEGFISPISGLKAFYLNFFTALLSKKRLKFSFKSEAMFVLKDAEPSIYFILHQFYLWYGYTKGLPGYDEKSRSLLKAHIDVMSESDVNGMSVEEIIGLKEAIARDREAAEFVIQLAKESSGAKKALEKMQQGGANI